MADSNTKYYHFAWNGDSEPAQVPPPKVSVHPMMFNRPNDRASTAHVADRRSEKEGFNITTLSEAKAASQPSLT